MMDILQDNEENLWVLTRIRESTYAIDSKSVQAIFLMDQTITPVADSDPDIMGVIPFRDTILPVIDLRTLMGMSTFEIEMQKFDDMLQQRIDDHINWVDELKRTLRTGEAFRLATDAHKCAFGKWYDHYKPITQSVSFHLAKIEDPHKKLHHCAKEMVECERDCTNCTREECLQNVLKKGVDVYMPEVVQLLEEAKEVFRESYHRMVVVITNGVSSFGLIVDEVISVEQLVNVSLSDAMGLVRQARFIHHIAQKKGSKDLIIALDLDSVFAMSRAGGI